MSLNCNACAIFRNRFPCSRYCVRNSVRSFTVHGLVVLESCHDSTGSGTRTLIHWVRSKVSARGMPLEHSGMVAAFSRLLLLKSPYAFRESLVIDRIARVFGPVVAVRSGLAGQASRTLHKIRSRFRRECKVALTASFAASDGTDKVRQQRDGCGSAGRAARAWMPFKRFSTRISMTDNPSTVEISSCLGKDCGCTGLAFWHAKVEYLPRGERCPVLAGSIELWVRLGSGFISQALPPTVGFVQVEGVCADG